MLKEAEAVAVPNESPKKGGEGISGVPKAGASADVGGKQGASGEKGDTPATKKLSPEEELAARFERLKQLR